MEDITRPCRDTNFISLSKQSRQCSVKNPWSLGSVYRIASDETSKCIKTSQFVVTVKKVKFNITTILMKLTGDVLLPIKKCYFLSLKSQI